MTQPNDDVCSAMTKQGRVMCICDLPKAPKHREHVDQTKQIKWEEERWLDQNDRVL